MSCVNWAMLVKQVWRSIHPGEQLASMGLGWKMDPNPWVYISWLITKFHTSHISAQDFFPLLLLKDLRALCRSPPSCLVLSVLLPRCLVGTDFTFLPAFCENCSTFAGSGDFETGTALSGFFNTAPGSTKVWRKEKRPSSDLSASFFSSLESDNGIRCCSPEYGI